MVGTVGTVFIVLFVLVILGFIGYVIYVEYNARRNGLPRPNWNPFASRSRDASSGSYRGPAPAPGGIVGFVNSKIAGLRNNRSASGAYESTGYASTTRGAGGGGAGTGRRGFGPLDPDEAWDTRVDHEMGGYYEEADGPYGGGGYSVGVGGRGTSPDHHREVDARYEEEMYSGGATSKRMEDPFADPQQQLRSVSPRPHGGQSGHKKGNPSVATNGSLDEHGLGERRSMFREDV